MDLLVPLFADAGAAAALSGEARLQAMLDFEAALAEAEAAVGVVPASCVAPIRAAARADLYDAGAIARDAARAGNLAIPLVAHLTRRVAATDQEAARYVHWGATSQDAIDPGLVLQLRAAVPHVLRPLLRAAAAAAAQAERHAGTPMAGRTWLQHATPTTFGLKAAGWLDALQRVHDRLEAALDEALVVQFGGASGTLAALGTAGPAVAEALGAALGLRVPDLPWHAQRDRLAHLAGALGAATGALGKIARDLALLAQTEVGEAWERPEAGRGGSSTMPHKRNPLGAAVALAAAARAPGLVATVLGAMPQEHERALGGWQAEWQALPELVLAASGAARAVADVLETLVVDPARMRANLESTGGLVMAEAASMALAPHVGLPEARALVEAACRRAAEGGRTLAEALSADATVKRYVGAAEIARRLQPDAYLGAALTFVERALSRWRARRDG
jgi:3-carboxy-cis,cis-muconate cycloisomerase